MSIEGPSANPPATAAPLLRQRYEVGERLGQGTFFDTYRGRDLESGRPVAIKVLKPEYAADEAFSTRLLAEAASSTRLTHPNIAQMYDAWREEGSVVLVTEWVRGINLKDRIRRVAPFPLPVAVDIMQACAEALNYAHEAGYIHGDVRPDNIIITPDGRVKLTDFGVGASAAASTRVQLSALPQAAYYLAPELVEGHPPDTRTDIYALGCIQYEMLTGHPPFDADTPLAIAIKHIRAPIPSLKAANSQVPNAVDGVTAKCMQKDPMARYVTLRNLLQDLHQIQDALHHDRPLTWTPVKAVEAPPVPEKPRGRRAEPAQPKPEARPRPEPEPASGDGGPSLKLLVGVALFGLLMIASFFGVVNYLARTPNEVRIPNLLGKAQADAVAELAKYRLKSDIQEEFSERAPQGTVYRTVPPADMAIREGKSVVLYVSKGPQPVAVPDVVGKNLAMAQREIKAAGLSLGTSTEEYSEVNEKGRVISQTPTGGTEARKSSPVTLVVSKGPEPIPQTQEPDDPAEDPQDGDDGDTPSGDPHPSGDTTSRQQEVKIKIPDSSSGPQQVRIMVRHEDGTEETSYDAVHQPGETVLQTVTTYGAAGKSRIRVYVNERLASTDYK